MKKKKIWYSCAWGAVNWFYPYRKEWRRHNRIWAKSRWCPCKGFGNGYKTR